MSKQTTKLKLPDGKTVEIDESKVHVWVSERSGNKVSQPYLRAFSVATWQNIEQNKGLLTAEMLYDPREENKKKAEQAKAAAEKERKANEKKAADEAKAKAEQEAADKKEVAKSEEKPTAEAAKPKPKADAKTGKTG